MKAGTKILFASMPFDGHFNPLTGLAVYLKSKGYDVRWYTQDYYQDKLRKLDIDHYPFEKTLQFNQHNLFELFPESASMGQLAKLNHDLQNIFIKRGPEFFQDIKNIHQAFPFDVLVADIGFTAIPFVNELMDIPVVSIGITPLIASSKELPPSGLGLTPSGSFLGRKKQDFLRFLADHILFRRTHQSFKYLLKKYEIHTDQNLFDTLIGKSTLVLQNGVPGLEYKRSDLDKHICFVGALLPYEERQAVGYTYRDKQNKYSKTILVTQGTVEKNTEKMLVPALEAFKNTEYLVIVTTGNSKTEELRARYPQDNIIIEDFIPFDEVMPHCDVYITNGGYGGVLLGIQHHLPMVTAGEKEMKNEICARVGYFRLGIDLKTEKPTSRQIRKAAEKVLSDPSYKHNVIKLSEELRQYNPQVLTEKYIEAVLEGTPLPKQAKAAFFK